MASCTVKTPSRLHFGLIDMHGGLGRVDGGVGITVNEPSSFVKVIPLEHDDVKSPQDVYNCSRDFERRAVKVVENLRADYDIDIKILIEITSSVPQHSGFGSTTQVCLAVGAAVLNLCGICEDVRRIASAVFRGGTSGIGVEAFRSGGFIVDGGHSFGRGKQKESFLPSSASVAAPPPVIARFDVPGNWYFSIIVADAQKIHGAREVNIFKKYCPIPARDVEILSRLILMKIMPSIYEGDIEGFGEGLNMMQDVGFKKYEIGVQHEIIGELIRKFREIGAEGSGMSSFGPAVYGLFEGRRQAEKATGEICEFMDNYNDNHNDIEGKFSYNFFTTNCKNSGADINIQGI